jgi:hypothetical protein
MPAFVDSVQLDVVLDAELQDEGVLHLECYRFSVTVVTHQLQTDVRIAWELVLSEFGSH